MRELVRPYADLDGIFESVEYRAGPTEPFEFLDIDGDDAVRVVPVDDLRTIPQHQLRIRVRLDVLKPHYTAHKDRIRLVIIVRDARLRKELRLADFPIDEIPLTIDLDRTMLRTTGLRDVLPLSIVVLWSAVVSGDIALPKQRASRLAELHFVLKNKAGGASFPYKRASAEELRKEGLPAETGVHLKLLCDALELIKESDTPIKNLFEVWLHEKIWAAIQNDRSPVASALRLSSVTLTATNLLLSAVAPLLKNGQQIEQGSAIGQLLEHVEKQASLKEGHLRHKFESTASLHDLEPHLQNAWRFVTSAGRVEEEVTE